MAIFNRLSNIRATHVSYVRRGANRKEFFLMKSDSSASPAFSKDFDLFLKSGSDKKLVYGVVYEPDALDSQNEFAHADAIEAAAHGFLADCRNIDLFHNFSPGVGTVVESYIAPIDFSIGSQTVKKGSWVLVTKASDEVWGDIKNGLITGYSMAGSAVKTPVDSFSPPPLRESGGLFHSLKSFFSGNFADNLNFQKGDLSAMDETLNLISAAVNDAISPLIDRLIALENLLSPDSSRSDSDLEPVIKAAVDNALAPFSQKLRALELSPGFSRQVYDPSALRAPNASVFSGLNF